jgi:hypothetical protein
MHNAPSVAYPVGRCAFQRQVYAVLCAISAALLMAWAIVQPMGWIWWLAAGCWFLAVLLGGHAFGRRQGTLSWTGQVWCLHGVSASEDALGEVSVCIDVQEALLLKWTPLSDGAVRWLWVGAENSPHLWQDLRRAVFATV